MFHKSFYSTLCNIFKAFIAVGVASVNGIIQAIRKHIAGNGITRVCAGIGIRIDETIVLRVIVSALQVLEAGFTIIIVSTISERIDFRQITLCRNYLAPRGVDVFRLHDAICVNDLDHVTLQIEDIVIRLKIAAVNGIIKGERAARIIVEEVQRFCAQNRPADVLPDRFSRNLAALRQILMRHSLGRGKRPVGFGQARLRSNRLFRRSRVRIWLDRLPRLVLQRNKGQWENKLCSAQKGTSFL